MTVRDALNSALDEEMSADSKVFVIGEEVWTCTLFTSCQACCLNPIDAFRSMILSFILDINAPVLRAFNSSATFYL